MPRHTVRVKCPVMESFEVASVRGMFDLPMEKASESRYRVEVPSEDELIDGEPWRLGVIVGPSGSGKSSVARQVWPDQFVSGFDWASDRAVVSGFGGASVKDITMTLSAVGFASPPAWLRPYSVLSGGERFRSDLARALLTDDRLVVFDEFTSVVDRTVAKVGSAAVAKQLRKGTFDRGDARKQFVAVTCHYDVLDWLEPDWVLDMSKQQLARGRLHRRPAFEVGLVRCDSRAWSLFAPHHYLTADISPSAVCFLAVHEGRAIGFDAWLPFFGKLKDGRKARRGHRTVVLPDYQGMGIGGRMFATIASMWAGLGLRAFSCTAHPAEMRSRLASPSWKMTKPPVRHSKGKHKMDRRRAAGRRTASFEYVGPPMERFEAERLYHAQR